MVPSRTSLIKILSEKVSGQELKDSVAYVIPELGPGEELVINRKAIKTEQDSVLLFIDLEPGVNWAHRCRYIMLNNNYQVQFEVDGLFPPEVEKALLLWKPENIEDWKLLTSRELGEI